MSQWNPTLCVYQSRKPQRLGATPPHRQGPAKQGRWCGAWYLAHLAVVLLVVGEIVWHLGSTQGKQGGNASLPYWTHADRGRRGQHSGRCRDPGLPPSRSPAPEEPPTPGSTPWPTPPICNRAHSEQEMAEGRREPYLWEARAGLGLTCEIRRYSCAFCRHDQNSGLCCAPAWKREKGLRCSVAYVCTVAGPWTLLVTPSHSREPGQTPQVSVGLGSTTKSAGRGEAMKQASPPHPAPAPAHHTHLSV